MESNNTSSKIDDTISNITTLAEAKVTEGAKKAANALQEVQGTVEEIAVRGGHRLQETTVKAGHVAKELATKVVHSVQETVQQAAHKVEEVANATDHRREELAKKASNKQ